MLVKERRAAVWKTFEASKSLELMSLSFPPSAPTAKLRRFSIMSVILPDKISEPIPSNLKKR